MINPGARGKRRMTDRLSSMCGERRGYRNLLMW